MGDRASEDSRQRIRQNVGNGSSGSSAASAADGDGGTAAGTAAPSAARAARTVFPVVFGVSLVHMLNDSMQSVVPAIMPFMQKSFNLTYTQIGLAIFMMNMTSSVLQPVVGLYSDRRPSPIMLPLGMLLSLAGLLGIGLAPNYAVLLASIALLGLGSAIFHPEGSKVVYLAAGQRRGLAQSIYQVGGNGGSSLQPLMTRYLFLPFGQLAALWFAGVAAAAAFISWIISRWYRSNLPRLLRSAPAGSGGTRTRPAAGEGEAAGRIARRAVILGVGILIVTTFARSTFHAAMMNYYQYYYVERFAATIADAQVPLFLFSLCGVIGTLVGGPLADRFGAKKIIIGSIAGASPLAVSLPHLPQNLVIPVMMLTGLTLMSGFTVMVVYTQMLMPKHIGTASGLIVGFSFGMGAIGAVILGMLIDTFGLRPVFIGASLLPLIGLVTFKLPKPGRS